MTRQTVTAGITPDTRQAALIVQTASKYQCKVQLAMEDKCINAKSIMGTVSLGICEGKVVDIIADGEDEAAAAAEVAATLL